MYFHSADSLALPLLVLALAFGFGCSQQTATPSAATPMERNDVSQDQKSRAIEAKTALFEALSTRLTAVVSRDGHAAAIRVVAKKRLS